MQGLQLVEVKKHPERQPPTVTFFVLKGATSRYLLCFQKEKTFSETVEIKK